MKKIALAIMLIAAPHCAMAEDAKPSDAFADVQAKFAASYNGKDLDSMAMAFAEHAIRVTPSGIFRGRESIRKSFQDALNLGLHDYAVRRVDTRSYGDLVFNTGEWQAKLREQSFHGYYTAILGRENGEVKILEETVTIAAP